METEPDEIPGFSFRDGGGRGGGGRCHEKPDLPGNAQVGRQEVVTHIRNLTTKTIKGLSFNPRPPSRTQFVKKITTQKTN